MQADLRGDGQLARIMPIMASVPETSMLIRLSFRSFIQVPFHSCNYCCYARQALRFSDNAEFTNIHPARVKKLDQNSPT